LIEPARTHRKERVLLWVKRNRCKKTVFAPWRSRYQIRSGVRKKGKVDPGASYRDLVADSLKSEKRTALGDRDERSEEGMRKTPSRAEESLDKGSSRRKKRSRLRNLPVYYRTEN